MCKQTEISSDTLEKLNTNEQVSLFIVKKYVKY